MQGSAAVLAAEPEGLHVSSQPAAFFPLFFPPTAADKRVLSPLQKAVCPPFSDASFLLNLGTSWGHLVFIPVGWVFH